MSVMKTIVLSDKQQAWLDDFLDHHHTAIGQDLYGHGPRSKETIAEGEAERKMIENVRATLNQRRSP